MRADEPASFRTGCLIVVGALVADQVTKEIVLAFAARLREGVPVLPGFSLVFGMNPGVSFGALGDVPWWGLTVLGLAIITGLIVWMWRETSPATAGGLGLIVGGALGNVVDRVRHGAVIDFLDLSVGTYHWPAFNLADTAITIGVVLLLRDGFRRGERRAPSGARNSQ